MIFQSLRHGLLPAAGLCLALFLPADVYAQKVVITDADVPMAAAPEGKTAETRSGPGNRPSKPAEVWRDALLNRAVTREADRFRIDPLLIHALIQQESGGRARAQSHKGAAGVMQLMPQTGARFGVRDRFSVSESVRGGVEYFVWLLDLFEGDVALALAGYNAGEGAVLKYGRKIPPYRETREYVRNIARRYELLRTRQEKLRELKEK